MKKVLSPDERPFTSPVVIDVRACEKNTLARITIAWMPGQTESMVQLTNPIAQHLAFYVTGDRKAVFIAELRAALTAWEKGGAL